jgi:anti-sigma B factor antagonist
MDLQLQRPPRKECGPDDVMVVKFTGHKVVLDEVTHSRICNHLLALADGPDESHVFLDFSNVAYLTSSTLGTLVQLHKKLLARGRQLTVGNVRPQVHDIFAVTRLDEFFDLGLVRPGDRPTTQNG